MWNVFWSCTFHRYVRPKKNPTTDKEIAFRGSAGMLSILFFKILSSPIVEVWLMHPTCQVLDMLVFFVSIFISSPNEIFPARYCISCDSNCRSLVVICIWQVDFASSIVPVQIGFLEAKMFYLLKLMTRFSTAGQISTFTIT